MTLVVDAGPVVALHDRRDRMRPRVETLFRGESGDLVIPAPVTAEIDYLLWRRGGERVRRAFLADLSAERYAVACLEPNEYATVAALEEEYADLEPGLADLSLVVIARRLGTRRIATFDERHFRAVRPLDGGAFLLLPDDE